MSELVYWYLNVNKKRIFHKEVTNIQVSEIVESVTFQAQLLKKKCFLKNCTQLGDSAGAFQVLFCHINRGSSEHQQK